MTDKERIKYIQEVYQMCGSESVLVICHKGHLEHIACPFRVMVRRSVGELIEAARRAVYAIKLCPELVDVYIVQIPVKLVLRQIWGRINQFEIFLSS